MNRRRALATCGIAAIAGCLRLEQDTGDGETPYREGSDRTATQRRLEDSRRLGVCRFEAEESSNAQREEGVYALSE